MRRTINCWLMVALLVGLSLVGGCAGLVSESTTTTKYLDKEGKPYKEVVTSGPVEAHAVAAQAQAAAAAMRQLPQLLTRIEIPRGRDEQGRQLDPAVLTVADSALYQAMVKLADMAGYQSPEVVMFQEGMLTARKAIPFGFNYLTVDAVVSKGTGSQTHFDNSFNGNSNSPAQIQNGLGSSQPTTVTDNDDMSDDHSSQTTEAGGEGSQ